MTIREAIDRGQADPANVEARSAPADERSLADLLEAAVSRAQQTRVGRSIVASIVVPIQAVDPIDLVAAANREGTETWLWLRPADGFALVGIGTAWSIRPEGPDRFSAAEVAWRDLVAGCVVHAPPGAPSVTGPLLVGGFPFRPTGRRASMGAPNADAWAGFETASLALPRFLVTIVGGLAWLTVSVLGEHDATPDAIGGHWARLVAAVTPIPLTHAAESLPSTSPISADEWQSTVARLAGAVGRGRMDKVVLARQVDVHADRDFDVPAVLRRLESSAPESTIFAVTCWGRTFLGATPERLAWVAGTSFATVALAGSAPRGADRESDTRLAAALLASEKEREEHKVVVDELRSALSPLADSVEIPSEPRVTRLRHVQHLETPIKGTLRRPSGVLPLVKALHPTPAVGGAPRALALELIDEQEKLDRGWYAGPLGWVGRDGDGEFVVAIRSGVVDGPKASLFAGCGIVADSDPSREWDESQVKLRALASALGELR